MSALIRSRNDSVVSGSIAVPRSANLSEQQAVAGEVVERRHEQPFRQIAGGAEDDHDARGVGGLVSGASAPVVRRTREESGMVVSLGPDENMVARPSSRAACVARVSNRVSPAASLTPLRAASYTWRTARVRLG